MATTSLFFIDNVHTLKSGKPGDCFTFSMIPHPQTQLCVSVSSSRTNRW